MTDSMLVMDRRICFRFKTSFAPCTIMQLTRYDLNELSVQTTAAVNKAPNFFIGSPVVLDLEMVKELGVLDFKQIKQILVSNNLVPVGVRGGSQKQHEEAATAGFPVITIGKPKLTEDTPKKMAPQIPLTKLVSTPVRSG